MDKLNFNSAQHLTREELVAYHKGYLSNKEMHRLEVHLIDCTLCKNALEGIALIEEADFNESLANITNKTGLQSKKVINRKQLFAIAASILLIAVVSIVYFSLPKTDYKLAEHQPAKEAIKQALPEKPMEEIEHSPTDTVSEQGPSDELLAEAVPEVPATSQPVQEKDIDTVVGADITTPEVVADSQILEEIQLAKQNLTSDTTTNPLEEIALTSATVQDTQNIAFRAKKAAEPTFTTDKPAIQEAEKAEVQTSPLENYIAAAPEKGDRAFRRYLKRNLDYPGTAKENNIEGEVILELTIGTDGTVKNIKVVQSLGFGCDQEAIRLIKEGPNWTPGSINGTPQIDKVKITILFKL